MIIIAPSWLSCREDGLCDVIVGAEMLFTYAADCKHWIIRCDRTCHGKEQHAYVVNTRLELN